MNIERIILEKSAQIYAVISQLVYKAHTLSTLVINSNGEIEDFERIVGAVVDEPVILNVLIAPDGIVTHVYPLAGNENVMGFNLFGEGAGNREALLAREKGELVVGGPFTLVQGGQALVGRLPVYLPGPDNDTHFWGLVSVTLKYPEALGAAGLTSLQREGFAFEIWRVNPDDNQRQIIACSEYPYLHNVEFVEEHIRLFHADWYFRILPVRAWHDYPEHIAFLLSALCISLLAGLFVQHNEHLKAMKARLEVLVCTDSLTGVFNRTGLMETLQGKLRLEKPFRLFYFDLNYFKQINDTYGHSVGDDMLKLFCLRFKRHLHSSHIFGRMGGDEFVLIQDMDVSDEQEHDFWKAIEREFEAPVRIGGFSLRISFSLGSAVYPEDGTTSDKLIMCADTRMYEQKRSLYDQEKKRRHTDWRAGVPPVVDAPNKRLPDSLHSEGT